MILNVCNSIKFASKIAFDFNLDSVSLLDCNRGDSSIDRIENALSIVYYIYMDTSDYHWKYYRVARPAPTTQSLNIAGISGSKYIPYFAQDMTRIPSVYGGGLPALSKVHE